MPYSRLASLDTLPRASELIQALEKSVHKEKEGRIGNTPLQKN